MSPSTSLSWSGSIAKPCEPNVKAKTLIDLRSSQLSKPMRVSDDSYAHVFGHRAPQNTRVSSKMPHTPEGLTKTTTTTLPAPHVPTGSVHTRTSPFSWGDGPQNEVSNNDNHMLSPLVSPGSLVVSYMLNKLGSYIAEVWRPSEDDEPDSFYCQAMFRFRINLRKFGLPHDPTLLSRKQIRRRFLRRARKLEYQGGEEIPSSERKKKKKKKLPRPPATRKQTSHWSTKYADFRRELKRNGIDVHEQHGLTKWIEKKYLISKTDDIASFIEGLILLIGAVCTSQSMANVSFILALYAQTHYSGSVFLKAQTLIKEFCTTAQGDDGEPEWLTTIKSVNSDWKQVVQNPAFSKISELLGMFVAMGIMSTEHVDFEIAGVRLFAKNIHSNHMTATNLTDAVLSTVTFFAEGGYYAIKTGSMKPLLFGNRDVLDFDNEYIYLSALFTAAASGNLVQMETTSEDFECRVSKFLEKGSQLIAILPSSFEKKIIMDRLVNIKKEFSEFTQKRIQGGCREAPLMMSIFGKSGVGKSTFVDFILPYILKANGFAHTDEYIAPLNPNSKYDSNWRSYMTAMKLDDWNNSKSDKTEVNPAQKIIEYCNNVRMYAEMAEIEKKGKVIIEPKVVSITTNTRDLGARDFSNEPASIVRRPKLHFELSVKPEFRKENSHELDTAKVEAKYGSSDEVIHDIWQVSVSYVKIVPGTDTKPKKALRILGSKRGVPKLFKSTGVPEEEVEDKFEGEINNKFHVPDDFVWLPYRDSTGPMIDVGMDRLLPFLLSESRKHFSGQSFVTSCTKEVGERLDLCESCSLPVGYCTCSESGEKSESSENLEFHGAYEESKNVFLRCYALLDTYWMKFDFHSLISFRKSWLKLERNAFTFISDWLSAQFPLVQIFEEATITQCYDLMKKVDENPWFRWTSYLPDSFLEKKNWRKYAIRSRREAINCYRVCNRLFLAGLGIFFFMVLPLAYWGRYDWSSWFAISSKVLFFLSWHLVAHAHAKRKKCEHDILLSIQKDRAMMPHFVKSVREDYVRYTLNAFVIVASIYSLYRLYKRVTDQEEPTNQAGNITDPTEEDVKARDAAGADKFWEPEYKASDFDALPKSKWTNNAELSNVVSNNLLYIKFVNNDSTKVCDGLMLKSNYLLVPKHMITTDCKELHCIRKPVDGICRNAEFKVIVDHSVVMPLKKHDLSVIYIANSGDFTDITSAFPAEMYDIQLPFTMQWRNKEGVLSEYRGRANPQRVYVEGITYIGCKYTLSEPTFRGMCMAPLLGQTKFPHILGVHLGGVEGTKTGVAGSPLHSEIMTAINDLQNDHPLHFQSAPMGDFPKEQYGKETFGDFKLKKSSPVVKVDDANCRFYGSCYGAVHSKSNVRELPMSPDIAETFGQPNIWGPPKFKGPDGKSSWKPWQDCLESSMKPSTGLPPQLLKRAFDDYLQTLTSLFDRKKFWQKEVRVLNDMEVVNGVDAKRFVDRMAADTSVGYPLTGPKSRYLEEIEHPDYCYATVLDPMFWEEAKRMEKCFLEGKRAYPIFKATLKDESTELTKDKVRVFQAAPIALQLLIRKYFLSMCRFISCNPLIAECAVGINPHSPEWDQLHNYITSKSDNCMAIDYKKYDTRMPCQLMYAAFSVYIELARHTGNFSEQDLTIMKGIATEVSNAVIAYNGELIMHIGTNPSGHNLTVYANSIANSLLFRCGFFNAYPDVKCKFADAVALTTYGDDAKGTVDPEYGEFNMITYRDFLQQYDIQITMAEKEAEFQPYIPALDADFLKRKSVFHEDLQIHMAAIEKTSIFKPMHSGLKSAVSDEVIMADALDNGLREMLYHGKEEYEDFRAKVQVVAVKNKLDHIMRLKDETYEDMLLSWACKHNLEDRLNQEKYAEALALQKEDAPSQLITAPVLQFPPSTENALD